MIDLIYHRHFFAGVLVFLDVCAAARYAAAGDGWRLGYWLCAGGITVCATWGLR